MRIGSTRKVLAVAGIVAISMGGVLAASGTNSAAPAPINSSHQLNAKTGRQNLALPISGLGALALPIPQAGAADKPQMAENVFKNIQVLRGIPVDDFMGAMGIMAASLGFCCSDCHAGAGTDKVVWEADNVPNKVTARKMVLMVKAINGANFGGKENVTCWTCHRGRDIPVTTPAMDTVYSEVTLFPDDIVAPAPGQAAAAAAAADKVLDKYVQALGGTQKLATLTSYVAHGTSIGFAKLGGGAKVEIFAKAPDKRATYIHFADPERGDSTRTFDGTAGYIAQPLVAVRRYALSGGELQGAKLDAELAFPAQIKQIATGWRLGPPATVKDHIVQVVQGDAPNGVVITLYFDNVTGLLSRMVRFTTTPIGRVPTQVDYGDYRLVGGIKVPYRWTFSWLDGQDSFQLTDVKLNATIDDAKFAMPAPAK